ncbi:MAG: HAD hydrolase-like protein, partial [Clostridia bacterium]|nr:HAD hydrolase-like protein [Clostridia bacterium]
TAIMSGLESGMSTVLVLSGISNQETLKSYAYRPSVVLDGVGDIVRLAQENK